MASLREIKTRINSVKSTEKITNAMYMVSTSKMLSAVERVGNAKPYSAALREFFAKIGKVTDYENPLLNQRKVNNIGILVIGASRGFVGSLSTNLVLEIAQLLKDNPEKTISAITMHKKGRKIAENLGLEIDYHFPDFVEVPTSSDISAVKKTLIDGFMGGKYDVVYLAYSKFIKNGVQKACVEKLLPLSSTLSEQDSSTEEKREGEDFLYKFEPSPSAVLDVLIPEYFENQIYVSLLESIASEHSARMIAMKNATDNARDLNKNLTLFYNRTRQSVVTQELIEIISGSM